MRERRGGGGPTYIHTGRQTHKQTNRRIDIDGDTINTVSHAETGTEKAENSIS